MAAAFAVNFTQNIRRYNLCMSWAERRPKEAYKAWKGKGEPSRMGLTMERRRQLGYYKTALSEISESRSQHRLTMPPRAHD
jgi:hypothetical protein